MDFKLSFREKLLQPSFDFDAAALLLFQYQSLNNKIYKAYLQHLNIDPAQIKTIEQIPFLPIEFFKTQKVATGDFDQEIIFSSSGTTRHNRSRHFVASLAWYNQNAQLIFEEFYGPLSEFVVLALLPSYLEQGGSSLVAMVDYFIKFA